jgi:hypothetical protein
MKWLTQVQSSLPTSTRGPEQTRTFEEVDDSKVVIVGAAIEADRRERRRLGLAATRKTPEL